MMPPAPGLLSMMTGLCRRVSIASPTMRAMMSAPPPAPKATTRRIGCCGQSCACAGWATAAVQIAVTLSAASLLARDMIAPSIEPRGFALLRRRNAKLLCNGGKPGALLVDRLGKFIRPAEVHDLAGFRQSIGNSGIRGATNVGRYAIAQIARHTGRAKQADQAVEHQQWMARFLGGRNVRNHRRTRRIGNAYQPDLAGIELRSHDRESRQVDLNAVFPQVLGCVDRIAVRHLGH